ncbi:hypothetical protein [Rubrivirga sp.]|uniref:hypothetical protein n=1 Tax=Rubrivirga sp. TaxID=1885344 RepID=UPI003B523F76
MRRLLFLTAALALAACGASDSPSAESTASPPTDTSPPADFSDATEATDTSGRVEVGACTTYDVDVLVESEFVVVACDAAQARSRVTRVVQEGSECGDQPWTNPFGDGDVYCVEAL